MNNSFKLRVKEFFENSGTICAALNRSQKLYFFGVVFCVLSAFWYVTPFEQVFLAALVTCGVLLTFGVISDLLYVYKIVWDSLLGKAVILLSYAFSTNLAYALSARVLNEIVKFDSDNLVYATNFVAVLLVPLFIVATSYIIFMLFFLFGQLYLMFAMGADQIKSIKCFSGMLPEKIELYPIATFVIRIFAFPAVLGFVWGVSRHAAPVYENFVEKTASDFIYLLEAKSYTGCQVSKNERAIKINDDQIIVVRKIDGTVTFSPQACVPVLISENKKQIGAVGGG